MNIKIISSQKKIFEGKAASIVLPAIRGRMEILENHSHVFVLLREGEIIVKKTKKAVKKIYVKGGVAEFYKNKFSAIIT